ncbi:MAG: acyl-CoA dehydrogenase family protein, partial [Mycobacteriaceae bacterium]
MSVDALFNSPERQELRATVRRFVQREVLPHLTEWERAGELPRSLHRRAAELGLLGIGFDEAVGGSMLLRLQHRELPLRGDQRIDQAGVRQPGRIQRIQ